MLSQITAITGLNLKSIPERWASSLVIVVGLAGVVAVFTALLAMATGFEKTLASTGRTDNAIILRGGFGRGAQLRPQPRFGHADQAGARHPQGRRRQAAGVGRNDRDRRTGRARATRRTAPTSPCAASSPMRSPLRPQLKIVEGRKFRTGLRELIVGRGVTRQFQGAELGKVLRMRGSDWTVVGVFESGDAYDSELWADAEVAQSTFNRGGYSSVLVGLEGANGLKTLQDNLKSDPRLTVDVKSQLEYFSGQTKNFRKQIGFLAGVVTLIMALGAIFAALNTMYAAVATRAKEIATLRAIGFGGMPVLVSVMIESLVLAFVGGVLGAVIAYLLFNNFSVSTLGENFTQVVFAFKVTPALVVTGLVIALVIGFFGGLLPAWRAARMPVTTALRAG